MDEHGHREIVDDKGRLTQSEVEELKRLALASRLTRWVAMAIAGLIAITGIDHFLNFMDRVVP